MESKHKQGIYEKYVKRMLDIVLSLVFILLFWWVYVIVIISSALCAVGSVYGYIYYQKIKKSNEGK